MVLEIQETEPVEPQKKAQEPEQEKKAAGKEVSEKAKTPQEQEPQKKVQEKEIAQEQKKAIKEIRIPAEKDQKGTDKQAEIQTVLPEDI